MLFHTSNTFTTCNHKLEEADVVFLGIPSSEGSLSAVSNYGPLIVRESLKILEDYINDVNIFEKLKICDVGDLEVVPGSYELTAQKIKETIEEIREKNKHAFLIFIGGNHLITLPVVEILKPKTIIQMDAHADLRKDYLGNPYMQQTWAYHAAKQGIRIIQLGMRSWNKEEKEILEKSNGKVRSLSLDDFLDNVKTEGSVHLTLDVDVFDPCYVKTGLPEPNGLTPEQVASIVDNIDPSSMDIVEISDNSLPSNTGTLAAKVLLRVLSNKLKLKERRIK